MGKDIHIGKVHHHGGHGNKADGKPARFHTSSSPINTSVSEASDVVALPGGLLGIVSDTKKKLYVVDERGREQVLDLEKLKGKDSQLEGVAYDPEKEHLFVSREEDRAIVRYDWDPDKGEPKYDTKLEIDLGSTKGEQNKGIEGLAYLSDRASPTGRPQLLAAKEGKPRELLMFDASGKGEPLEVDLDKAVKDVLKDFSGMAVDPKSGHLFLSSDASSVVAQVRLVRDGKKVRGKLVQAIPIENEKKKPLGRIEGLAFNKKGDLYVLTENDGVLHELKRKG